MTGKESILRFLGLAMRAGKLVSGMDAVVTEIRKGSVSLIIAAEDISRNSLDKILRAAQTEDLKGTELFKFGNSFELGNAIGKSDRAVVGVTDDEFAHRLSEMLEEYE